MWVCLTVRIVINTNCETAHIFIIMEDVDYSDMRYNKEGRFWEFIDSSKNQPSELIEW